MKTLDHPSEQAAKAERNKAAFDQLNISGVIEKMRSDVTEELVSSEPHEQKIRETAYLTLRVLGEFEQVLKLSFLNGEIAKMKVRKNG